MPAPTNKSFSLLNTLEAKEYNDDVVKPFFFFIIMDALINTNTNHCRMLTINKLVAKLNEIIRLQKCYC